MVGNPTPFPAGRLFPMSFEGEAGPRFAEDAGDFFTQRFDLGTVRNDVRIAATGTMLWAIDASNLNSNITINFNDQRGPGITFRRGMFMSGLRFDSLFVTNAAQAGETIDLFFGVERSTGVKIENPLIAFQNVSLSKASTITLSGDQSVAGLTAATLLAANPARREVILSNPVTNLSPFRVGGLGVAVNKGIELNPGQTIFLSSTDTIKAFNTDAAAQMITRAEILD